MIYYILHNLLRTFSFTENWEESKKNCLTFIFGSTFYVLLFCSLEYFCKLTKNLFLELITKFFLLFVGIDAVGMAIIYKLYYGRNILHEIDASREHEWILDDKTHKYNKKSVLRKEKRAEKIEKELMDYYKKSNDVEELKEKTDNLEKNTDELREKTDDLEKALLYHPDGPLAQEIKSEFEELAEQQNK